MSNAREKIKDMVALAEEHGAKTGVIPAGDGLYEMVMVQVRTDEGDFVLHVTDYDGREVVRLMMHREDLDWLFENPMEDDYGGA